MPLLPVSSSVLCAYRVSMQRTTPASPSKQYLCPGLSCCDPKYLSKALAPEAHLEDGRRRREEKKEKGRGRARQRQLDRFVGATLRRGRSLVASSPVLKSCWCVQGPPVPQPGPEDGLRFGWLVSCLAGSQWCLVLLVCFGNHLLL